MRMLRGVWVPCWRDVGGLTGPPCRARGADSVSWITGVVSWLNTAGNPPHTFHSGGRAGRTRELRNVPLTMALSLYPASRETQREIHLTLSAPGASRGGLLSCSGVHPGRGCAYCSIAVCQLVHLDLVTSIGPGRKKWKKRNLQRGVLGQHRHTFSVLELYSLQVYFEGL